MDGAHFLLAISVARFAASISIVSILRWWRFSSRAASFSSFSFARAASRSLFCSFRAANFSSGVSLGFLFALPTALPMAARRRRLAGMGS
jgi:hypothetical protein